MTPECRSHRRYRCRFCGAVLHAWLPMAQEPDGALLLGHLSWHHRDRVQAFTDRMHYDTDITPVAAEAYELIEVEAPCTKPPLPTS